MTRKAERIAKLEVLNASLAAELEAERQAHELTRQQLFEIRAEAEAAAERSRRWWQRRKGGAPSEPSSELFGATPPKPF